MPSEAVEQLLANMPDLLPAEKDWLRANPATILDPHNQRRLEVAFADAQTRGIERASPEYFQFFDERLGLKPEDTVSGSGSAYGKQSTRVTLSGAEADMAKSIGLSLQDYAKGKQELDRRKAAGMYKT